MPPSADRAERLTGCRSGAGFDGPLGTVSDRRLGLGYELRRYLSVEHHSLAFVVQVEEVRADDSAPRVPLAGLLVHRDVHAGLH